MASTITVTVQWEDKSSSLTIDYPCADTYPSDPVIKGCEEDALERWQRLKNTTRGTETHIKIRARR